MYRTWGLLVLAALLIGGCRNMDNRRDARAAAFEPLRPAPSNRILPDKPVHLRQTLAQKHADKKEIAEAQKRASQGQSYPAAAAATVQPSSIAIRPSVDALAGVGLKFTVSKYEDHAVYLYLIAEKPVQLTLLARALNQDGQEIVRTRTQVNMKQDDAGYTSFRFNPLVPDANIKTIEIAPIAEKQ